MPLLFQSFVLIAILLSSSNALADLPKALTKVSIVTTQYTSLEPTIISNGTSQAAQGVVVKPETSGKVRKILFKSGDYVTAGTPLIELNNDILKADFDLTSANLALSQQDYARKKELFPRHAIAQSELDAALANLKVNTARVGASKAQLEQTLIKAPFSGKLGLRQVDIGDQVTPNTPIVNLQALDSLYVDFTIPESDRLKIAVGQKVIVNDDAYPETPFTGQVSAIESVINTNAQSLTVRAEIPNSQGTLLPGSFMRVTVTTEKPQNVISIPQSAILHAVDGNYVYRVIKSKAVKTKVVTGLYQGQNVVIKDGLKPGEQVIVAGQLKIFDGADVEVTK